MECRLTLLAAALTIAALAGAAAQEPKQTPTDITKDAPKAAKPGGILRMYHRETPGGISIHEEATYSTNTPMMGVFNNLVIYDQHKPQNSLDTVVPELATSWSWNADKTQLTFLLRDGVKWHDGQPFTAKDVKCTWDMLRGVSQATFRKNPRKDWYENVSEVSLNGANGVTFSLKRPQPSLLAMLASGYSPVYPCHVPPAQMRTHPIGTGPYRFVEMKQNETIKLVKNSDYWKKGLPYLDGIEFAIIPNRSTAVLAFVTGKVDMTFPTEVTVALQKDIKAQVPNAVCDLEPTNVNTNLIINRDAPPFDNPDLRSAMAMALDRKAFVDILFQGQADIGGALLPPPSRCPPATSRSIAIPPSSSSISSRTSTSMPSSRPWSRACGSPRSPARIIRSAST